MAAANLLAGVRGERLPTPVNPEVYDRALERRGSAGHAQLGHADQALVRAARQDARMGAQPDTFLGFIDVLAADLDDHEVAAEDRAAQLHLSRYHFDRVIRATAGEPPAAFRRRILMERAAFRLATSRDGVLRWPSTPATRQRGVHAGVPTGATASRRRPGGPGRGRSSWTPRTTSISTRRAACACPASARSTPMNLLIRMVEHHLWLVGEMVDRAAKVDDATLDRPIELSVEQLDDKPTMRKLLSRLVGQMDMWRNVIAGRGYDMGIEAHESVPEIRARLDVAGPAFLAEVRRVVEGGRLDETFIDAPARAGRGLHLRRAHRPRADLRRAPPAPRPRRARVRRASGPRQRRPARVGRRARSLTLRFAEARRWWRFARVGPGRARSSVAEQGTFNPRVLGSNPSGPSTARAPPDELPFTGAQVLLNASRGTGHPARSDGWSE